MFTDSTTIKKQKPKYFINKILYKYFKLGNEQYKKLIFSTFI